MSLEIGGEKDGVPSTTTLTPCDTSVRITSSGELGCASNTSNSVRVGFFSPERK